MSTLEKIGKPDLLEFLRNCEKYADFDVYLVYRNTLAHIFAHDGKAVIPSHLENIKALETQWYDSIARGTPDYSVYGSPFYFCDIWVCWIRYSRKYLKEIQKPSSMFTHSIVKDMKNVQTVLDLGCGFAYTTAALKEIFPLAKVTGTNLKDTIQYKSASALGLRKNFDIVGDYKNKPSDLIFASEYFEHIDTPVEHLLDVLKHCNPKYMLVASTFSSPAIGHFPKYRHNGEWLDGKKISKLFNNVMREHGYEKIKTRCWNGKPAYWKKVK